MQLVWAALYLDRATVHLPPDLSLTLGDLAAFSVSTEETPRKLQLAQGTNELEGGQAAACRSTMLGQ